MDLTELINWRKEFDDVLNPRLRKMIDEFIKELKLINSDAQTESQNVSQNEKQKKFCPCCKDEVKHIDKGGIIYITACQCHAYGRK